MRTDLETKLLDLSRTGSPLRIEELKDELQVQRDDLIARINELVHLGIVSAHDGMVEVDSKQRMRLAEQLIRNGRDPSKISRFLKWQEFEDFASDSLRQNGFRSVKHLVFKSRNGRREIDLLAWNDNLLLAIDCKHWSHGLSPSRVRNAAEAQTERATALAARLDILGKYGVTRAEKRSIMPVIVSLCDPRERIVGGVPVVAVSKLMSFLYGVSPVDGELRMIPVESWRGQSVLI